MGKRTVIVWVLAVVSLLMSGCYKNDEFGLIENATETSTAWTSISPANRQRQSFTAVARKISAVEVRIVSSKPDTGDTIALNLLANNGSVMFTTSAAVPSGFDGWLKFTVPNLETDIGGILMIQIADTGKIAFGWKYGGNTYPGGCAYICNIQKPENDFLFKVH